MKFNSLYDIVTYFKMGSASHPDVLDHLKRDRNKIHPDKNGGNFTSADEEKKYHDLNEAIEWIDSNNSSSNTQLITINQITDIIKAITSVEKYNNTKNEIEEKNASLVKSLETTKALVLKRVQLPKIATTVVATIISFIWLFPKQISQHPILGSLINTKSSVFLTYWLISLGIAIYLWLYAYVKEFKQQSLNRMIASDTYQNDVFKRFLAKLALQGKDKLREKGYLLFSKTETINFISESLQQKRKPTVKDIVFIIYTAGIYSLYFIQPTIDIEIVEKLADLLIKKNIDKGIIKKYEGLSFEDLFKTTISVDEIDRISDYLSRNNKVSSI